MERVNQIGFKTLEHCCLLAYIEYASESKSEQAHGEIGERNYFNLFTWKN